MGLALRHCHNCHKPYYADTRNLKRGWGKTCSKSCAAKMREKSKPGYNPVTVAENNERRDSWNDKHIDDDGLDYLLERGS